MSEKLHKTITVRMKVARSGLMSSTPTFAKIAVSAANTADSTAQTCHDDSASAFMKGSLGGRRISRHSGARVKQANYDVQLHIGESRDSGYGPSDHSGMTRGVNFDHPAAPG